MSVLPGPTASRDLATFTYPHLQAFFLCPFCLFLFLLHLPPSILQCPRAPGLTFPVGSHRGLWPLLDSDSSGATVKVNQRCESSCMPREGHRQCAG